MKRGKVIRLIAGLLICTLAADQTQLLSVAATAPTVLANGQVSAGDCAELLEEGTEEPRKAGTPPFPSAPPGLMTTAPRLFQNLCFFCVRPCPFLLSISFRRTSS